LNRSAILYSLFFLFFTGSIVHAQVNPILYETISSQLKDSDAVYFEKGRHQFTQEYYLDAIPYFEMVAQNKPEIPELNFILGICYSYHVNETQKALTYMHKAEVNADKIDGFYFNLGFAYEENENITLAINYYKKAEEIARKKGGQGDLMKEIRYRLQRCDQINRYHTRQNLVQIKNIGKPINSDGSEYCPLITSNESLMIFTYRGPKSKGGKQKLRTQTNDPNNHLEVYFEDVFISRKLNDSTWSEPQPAANINTLLHDAAVSLSPDGTELFIYRNNGAGSGDLYLSVLENGEYTKPIYQAGLNSHEWDGSACFIPYQNKIIFASERKGGFGGKDLYTAEKIKPNTWGNIHNMGPTINSKYDEDAPFVTADGKILFYSSNNTGSLGGYDIFRSDLKNNFWSAPYNLGAPINTKNDDKYFTVRGDGKVGYYSSYKQGGKGEQDIYTILPGIPGMPIELLEVNGFATLDGKPVVADIEINSIYKNNKFSTTAKTKAADGNFVTNLPSGDKYEVLVKLENFPPQKIELNTVGIDSFVVLNVFAEFNSKDFIQKYDELAKKEEAADVNFDKVAFASKYGNLKKEGLTYKVQVGAYLFFENFNYNNVMGFPKIIRHTDNDYITRFVMGNYLSYNEALELLEKITKTKQLKGAFILANYKGERLYLEQLLEKKIVE
jgi:tetratricopeptide (TPR) repeat protein